MTKHSRLWSKRALAALASLVMLIASGQVASADTQQQGQQRVVITLQVDPLTDQEPACVALQLGTLLLSQGASVTLFPTLEGVGIANVNVLKALANAPAEKANCLTQEGPAPLPAIVDGFLDAGGTMVVCPLCWISRYGAPTAESLDQLVEAPTLDGVQLGDGVSIGNLFLDADKVIDF